MPIYDKLKKYFKKNKRVITTLELSKKFGYTHYDKKREYELPSKNFYTAISQLEDAEIISLNRSHYPMQIQPI